VPDTISDFAHGKPLLASTVDAVRDAVPWLDYLTDRERQLLPLFDVVILPDMQVTKRMQRHMVVAHNGHRMAVFKTLDECWLYAEALELATVGLVVAGRAVPLNPARSAPPSLDPNQMGLFDTVK